MKKFYFPFFLIFHWSISAQISFTNSNNLLVDSDIHSGVAIGVADMNGDGLDDIVRLDQGSILRIEYQNGSNQMFSTYEFGDLPGGSQWSMCIGDVDNNGFNDVLAGGSYDQVKLVTANNDGSAHTLVTLPGATMFVQGSNMADINNDGFVDVFACHDDAESRIWGNDGSGNMIEQDGWIDMTTDPVSDNSGNYGSVWTDLDNDGDLDLYIAKCRQGVGDPTDPRRINQLYINDGNNNYTEDAESYGLKIGWQSWTADFQDVNNDGFLDCFITNHDAPSQLLINDGNGYFNDISATSGISISGTPIQGVMRDFDNDGFVDILVAGGSQHLFRNNGDETFTEVTGIFDNNDMESYALGDLNADGFVDIYGGYANIYTNPSSIDDVLWLNEGNNNNHLSVNLIGTESNRNAIGSRIEIYGDWGIQIREVRSGESYGIMNSLNQYFGLGTATNVDSIVVKWPSGSVSTEYDIDANTKLTLLEGGCLGPNVSILPSGPTTFCSGDVLTLAAPIGFQTYEWSNGATTPNIDVTTQGNYSVTVTNAEGCLSFSQSVSTIVDPVLNPMIIENGELQFCEGGSVMIAEIGEPNAASYNWSNGMTGSSVEITESGEYFVTVEGLCDNYISNAIIVNVIPNATEPAIQGDTIFDTGSAELLATGMNPKWYDVPTGGNPLGVGNNFTTPVISQTTLFYVEDANVVAGVDESVGKESHTGGSLYSGSQNSNNNIEFDAFEPFVLKTTKVYTDTPGERKMIVLDNTGTIVAEKVFMAEFGETIVELDLEIPAGLDMIMTTEEAFNLTSLGIGGPRLQRSSQGVDYPYVINNVVSLNESNFGPQYYYYFYDWKVETPNLECVSPRVAVEALLDPSLSATDFDKTGNVRLFPNPTNDKINIEINFDPQSNLKVNVIDVTGKVVLNKAIDDKNDIQLNLQNLSKGIYMVQVIDNENIYSGRVVVQ